MLLAGKLRLKACPGATGTKFLTISQFQWVFGEPCNIVFDQHCEVGIATGLVMSIGSIVALFAGLATVLSGTFFTCLACMGIARILGTAAVSKD